MGRASRPSPTQGTAEGGCPHTAQGTAEGGCRYEGCYSSTKMFFFAQISFKTFGHTVTLTSPR
jgi:hypothetical protein